MSLGYLGYIKLGNIYLLANSSGLNRQINPLQSNAVWGAGWYNAAAVTNYADAQQHYEGQVQFELQGSPTVWNTIRDWLVEQRINAKSLVLSPNGISVHSYTVNPADPRTGAWMNQASISIDANALMTMNATLMALKRTESAAASSYANIVMGPGTPTSPLNPAPHNRNPFPGWAAKATIVLPGIPTSWTESNFTGLVLQQANFNVNNNMQVIRGCTGDKNPVAVLAGTMAVDGSVTLWRDGGIPDPYDQPGVPFTASGSSIHLDLGQTNPLTFDIWHVLLTSDAYDITGQNNPSTRVFGIAGLGDGVKPPFQMGQA